MSTTGIITFILLVVLLVLMAAGVFSRPAGSGSPDSGRKTGEPTEESTENALTPPVETAGTERTVETGSDRTETGENR